MRHREGRRMGRIGWLRAAVLRANDGIVSTSSLVAGVAAAGAIRNDEPCGTPDHKTAVGTASSRRSP